MFWTYSGLNPKRDYIDPRIAVARQIGWQKLPGDETNFTVPEPDNYNHCIIMDKPTECKFIESQVVYKDKNKWFTLMLVPDELISEYNQWLLTINPEAYWQHTRPPKLKSQRKSPMI